MQTKRFRDFYGCIATIKPTSDGRSKVKVCLSNGKTVCTKVFASERGAKIALGKMGDSWKEI